MSRLKEKYENEIVPELIRKFNYKNKYQVPKLVKIVINMGVGESTQNPKLLDAAMNDLALITGQKPKLNRAKKSVANFKLRAGMPIGCSVTLRGTRMYDFLDRFLNLAAPRIRDFRGFPPDSFDGRGNYNIGIDEQIIFYEIDYDKVEKVMGMNITFVTTARTDNEARALLSGFGFPFSGGK
ncbi:MAG: 50S ribosomal protein L5 [bacterium]